MSNFHTHPAVLTVFLSHFARVHVISADALPEDSRITGPMIVVHIVDSSTGRYITRTANPEVIFSLTAKRLTCRWWVDRNSRRLSRHDIDTSSHTTFVLRSATNYVAFFLLFILLPEFVEDCGGIPYRTAAGGAEVYPTDEPHDDILLVSTYDTHADLSRVGVEQLEQLTRRTLL